MHEKRNRGVTLVELMVVAVIVGILAAVAYPSYTNYMRQTRRSDAQLALTRVAALQEKYYSDFGFYATAINASRGAGGGAGAADAALGLPSVLSPDGHYLLSVAFDNINPSCTAANHPCNAIPVGPALTQCLASCGYTLVADPTGAGTTGRQANDGKLRIDAVGNKQWDKANNNSYSARWTDK